MRHQRPGRGHPGVERAAESGFVAGSEALILGVLVFVLGTVVVLNGWAVLDAKYATSAAAREAVRAVVEAPGGSEPTDLRELATSAARTAVAAFGYDAAAVSVTPELPLGQDRCAPVRLRVEVDVRTVDVAGLTRRTTFVVGSVHEEVIDPFRSGLGDRGRCGF
jgi:hypothetical protein